MEKEEEVNFVITQCIEVHELVDFAATGYQIQRAVGCSHVIVVPRWPVKSDSLHTHAIFGLRWTKDDKVLCLNSHGVSDARPKVGKDAFVKGFWVDVILESHCVPSKDGGRKSENVPVEIDDEWAEVVPLSA